MTSQTQANEKNKRKNTKVPDKPSAVFRGTADYIKKKWRHFFNAEAIPADKRKSISIKRKRSLRYTVCLFMGVAQFGCAFLFSRAHVMQIHPFGLAYLCAATKYVPFIFLGTLFGSVGDQDNMMLLVAASVFIFSARYLLSRFLMYSPQKIKNQLRTDDQNSAMASTAAGDISNDIFLKNFFHAVMPGGIFGENAATRAGIGAVAALLLAIFQVILSGFTTLSVVTAIFTVAAVPAMTYAFTGAFDGPRAGALCEAGTAAVLFSLVLSFDGMLLFGLSLKILSAFFFTLYISKTGGILRGGVIGLLCGLACDPIYAPLFALAGFASGVFWGVGCITAVLVACAAGIGYAVYINGFAAIRSVVPDLLVSAAIFYPFARYQLLPHVFYGGKATAEANEATLSEAFVTRQRESGVKEKIQAMSEVFSSLSGAFYGLAERMRRPCVRELQQLCDETCEKYCSRCSYHSLCWERELEETEKSLKKLTSVLYEKGRVEKNSVPERLQSRCLSLEKIISELNEAAAALLEEKILRDKTEVFAMDYEAMSKLLTAAIEENAEDFEPDIALSRRVRRAMEYMDFYAQNVTVFGSRKKSILAAGVDLNRMHLGADELRTTFENLAGVHYHAPSFEINDEYVTMSLTAAPCFEAEWSVSQDNKESESMCGDAASLFANREDYFYAILSDGMGSGRDASVTAQLCSMFLERMLLCGNRRSVTLEMLNGFLRSRSDECSATVDLAEIDLITGEACFIKSGAAPSFIVRDGNIFRISSNTTPMGILRSIHAEQTRFQLLAGDIIVMVSDGIAPETDEGIWLAELLANEMCGNLRVMAERIVNRAKERNLRTDDMTAVLIRVTAKDS